MRLAVFSTDDLYRPRNAILLDGLRLHGNSVSRYNYNAWTGYKDKSHISGFFALCILALRYCFGYCLILWRYCISPRHDFVYVPYMGLLDVLVVWPFAKLRRERIVWDSFICLHETVVDDRKLLSPRHIVSRLLYGLEQLATWAADLVLFDTRSNADFFCRYYQCSERKTAVVPIGAHSLFFDRSKRPTDRGTTKPITVVYFGTYIPLHGAETIFQAAELTPPELASWVLIGKGQALEDLLKRWPDGSLPNVEHIAWKPHAELLELIDRRADICLGVFGNTAKASRVVPNKLYESVARGVPVITLDCEPVRELLPEGTPGAWLVPAADPRALSAAIIQAAAELSSLQGVSLFETQVAQITPAAIGATFSQILEERR